MDIVGEPLTMTLAEWAELPGQSLFDVEVWTIARVHSPTERQVRGFVLFSAPLPYHVLLFDSVEEIARYLRRPVTSLIGVAYRDIDWARGAASSAAS